MRCGIVYGGRERRRTTRGHQRLAGGDVLEAIDTVTCGPHGAPGPDGHLSAATTVVPAALTAGRRYAHAAENDRRDGLGQVRSSIAADLVDLGDGSRFVA